MNLVEALIQRQANVNAETKHGETPLHRAALKGYLDVVKKLIESGANLQSKMNDTPLLYAAIAGHLDIAQELVGADADITLKGEGQTAEQSARCLSGPIFGTKNLQKMQKIKTVADFLESVREKRQAEDLVIPNDPTCSICLDSIETGEKYIKHWACKKGFHEHCIEPWLKSDLSNGSIKRSCPICRLRIPQEIVTRIMQRDLSPSSSSSYPPSSTSSSSNSSSSSESAE